MLTLAHVVLPIATFLLGVILSQKVKDLLSGISAELRVKAKAEADKVIAEGKAKLGLK